MTVHILLYFGIFICLLMSTIFSAAETAITAASRARMHKLKMAGNKSAAIIIKLKQNKEKFIGTILIGNNATNIVATALATTLAVDQFSPEGVAIFTFLLATFVLIFCEMLPKTYAFEYAEKAALFLAPITNLLMILFSPIIRIFKIIVDFCMRFFHNHKHQHTEVAEEEIRSAIEMHHHEGHVHKVDKDMLGGILDLGDMEVNEIMVHRRSMLTLNFDQEPRDLINSVLSDYTHTRIPLWQDNQDNIVGILNVKDLLVLNARKSGHFTKQDLAKIITKPWFIPESTLVKEQLQEFLKKRLHFAIVIDEYGSLMGMITLEDIIEEIVGHIEDEHDIVRQSIVKISEDVYVVNGEETIRDINRKLNLNLPDEEASTIAGLIIYEAENIPEKGEQFEFHNIKFEIIEKSQNRLSLIKMSLLPSQMVG